MKITVEVVINAPLVVVWDSWTTPDNISRWNFASDDWHCPSAELELKEGGGFHYRMEAKDKTGAFDFTGVFTKVVPHHVLCFELVDKRPVEIEFSQTDDGVRLTETFEAENIHTPEQQKEGWQSILNNFKKYVESKAG
jgi:uncharacterized protein YndB with AHSA1/START domain